MKDEKRELDICPEIQLDKEHETVTPDNDRVESEQNHQILNKL